MNESSFSIKDLVNLELSMDRKSSSVPIHIKLLAIDFKTRMYLVYYPDLNRWDIIAFREVKGFSPLKKVFWRCENMTLKRMLDEEGKKVIKNE